MSPILFVGIALFLFSAFFYFFELHVPVTIFHIPFSLASLLLALSGVCAILSIYKNGFSRPQKEFFMAYRNVFLCACLLSIALTLPIFIFLHGKLLIDYFFRAFFNMAALFLVTYYGSTYAFFPRALFFLFALPGIAYIPFLYLTDTFPSLLNQSNYFFKGPTLNTTYWGIFLTIGILYIFAHFVFLSRGWKKTVLFIIFSFLLGMLMWAGSRATFLGLFFGFLYIVWNMHNRFSHKGTYFLKMAGTIFFAVILGFLLIPRPAKLVLLSRFNRNAAVTLVHARFDWKTGAPMPKSVLNGIAVKKDFFIPQENRALSDTGRFELWRLAWGVFKKNIFGYGIGYTHVVAFDNGGLWLKGVHNIFFEVLVMGGIAALCAFLALCFQFFKNAFFNRKKSAFSIVSYAALFAVLIAFIFSDGISIRWFWMLLGLCLVLERFWQESDSMV